MLYRAGNPEWQTQLVSDVSMALWAWISDYHMQWPMLAAAVSRVSRSADPREESVDVRPALRGCGSRMRIRAVIPFMAFSFLPLIVNGSMASNTWILWGIILFAESLAL